MKSTSDKPDQSGVSNGELRERLAKALTHEWYLHTELRCSDKSGSKKENVLIPGSIFQVVPSDKTLDDVLTLIDDMRREATCNDIAADQPNDVHIGYFNKGFEAGVRKCREAMPEKQEGEHERL